MKDDNLHGKQIPTAEEYAKFISEQNRPRSKKELAADDLYEALVMAQCVLNNVESRYYGSDKDAERIDLMISKAIEKAE